MGTAQSSGAVDTVQPQQHVAVDVNQRLLPNPPVESVPEAQAARQAEPGDPPPNIISVQAARDVGPELKQCRFCLESEEDGSNPFISPCRCSGTMKYVHRRCLQKWRASAREEGRPASFRCEACHFEYRYHRLWLASLLRNTVVRCVIYLTTIAGLCFVAGYVPAVVVGDLDVRDIAWPQDPADHMLHGLLVLCAVGVVSTSLLACCGRPSDAPTLYELWRLNMDRPSNTSPDIKCCVFCIFTPAYVVLIAIAFATTGVRHAINFLCTRTERLVENVS